MADDLAAYRLGEMKLVIAREWDCPFNWKTLVENFMESYHHLGIHHKTLQPMMPARDTWTEQERRRYVRAHLPYKDSVREEYRAFEEKGDFSAALPPVSRVSGGQKSQWGLYASGWQPGRLSHLEMPVWLFHRYLAARVRGVWPTDDYAAVPGQRP